MSLLQKTAKYSSGLISPLERKVIKTQSAEDKNLFPVFIVGAPRSGSTFLYQVMTNTFDMLYPDNLINLFYRNLYWGTWLSRKVFKEKAHNCFSSRHGNTESCGLHAPNEFGNFWYRWLPKETHYIERNDIDISARNEIQRNLLAVMNRFDRPILFKNLNAGQRMDLIASIVPQARFVIMKRNPLYTAQSIYQVRTKLGIKSDQWWSIKPKNFKELQALPICEQIVKQVYFLEKQIAIHSQLFDPNAIIEVDYRALSLNLEIELDKLIKFLKPVAEKRIASTHPQINYAEKQTVPDRIMNTLRSEINKLNWKTYD